jgi:hypothetical protein
METKRHQVNLKQYRKLNGKWQFVPVARDAEGKPDPRLVLVDGRTISSKGGTFYLDFSESGKLRQKSVGTVPKEALEAWRTKLAILTGEIEPDPEEEPVLETGLTVERAIENYLVEVEATKGVKTYRQYRRELEWFRIHCKKRYVSELERSDAMALFAQGRREELDGKPLNQKTINRRVIIMLHAMRSQGQGDRVPCRPELRALRRRVHRLRSEQRSAAEGEAHLQVRHFPALRELVPA